MSMQSDALFRRLRRDVVAPEWAKPYLLVGPIESRRLLATAFTNGSLNLLEVNATRAFLRRLQQAEKDGERYPSWEQFLDEDEDDEDMSASAFRAEAESLVEVSDWRNAFSKTINHNRTDVPAFNRFFLKLDDIYGKGD